MNWLKKAYQDDFTKWMTIGILVGGPLFSILIYFVDQPTITWWQPWAFAWAFFLVIVLPFLYFKRNAQ